jgi:hypothetical protein
VYRRILGPVYDNEKDNWDILTNKEVYAILKTHHDRDNNATQITLVWTCTENGRRQNSQNSIAYAFGNNKTNRETKK